VLWRVSIGRSPSWSSGAEGVRSARQRASAVYFGETFCTAPFCVGRTHISPLPKSLGKLPVHIDDRTADYHGYCRQPAPLDPAGNRKDSARETVLIPRRHPAHAQVARSPLQLCPLSGISGQGRCRRQDSESSSGTLEETRNYDARTGMTSKGDENLMCGTQSEAREGYDSLVR